MSTETKNKLAAARAAVNAQAFGTPAWESAMAVVRSIVDQINASKTHEEFFSVDSGFHRTMLNDGRIIGTSFSH